MSLSKLPKDLIRYQILKYLNEDDLKAILSISRFEDFNLLRILYLPINLFDDYALKNAIINGPISLTKSLLKTRMMIGESECFKVACQSRDISILEYLYEIYSKNLTPFDEYESLIIAVKHENLTAIKFLVSKGFNIHNESIHIAYEKKFPKIAEYLIFNFHFKDDLAMTFDYTVHLEQACFYSQIDLFKFILSNVTWVPPIHILNNLCDTACERGQTEIVAHLIDIGADCRQSGYYWLRTVVSNISRRSISKMFDIIKLLVSKGADFRKDYEIVLVFASEIGYEEIVEYLIENGADIDEAIKTAREDYFDNALTLLLAKKKKYSIFGKFLKIIRNIIS
jgi:hypothetical protein